MLSWFQFQLVTSTEVAVLVAVKLRVPSVRRAPAGIACTCSASVSEPSVSDRAAPMADSLIGALA
jgi:hypothetical protein